MAPVAAPFWKVFALWGFLEGLSVVSETEGCGNDFADFGGTGLGSEPLGAVEDDI